MKYQEPTNPQELDKLLWQFPFKLRYRCALIACEEALLVWDSFAEDADLSFVLGLIGTEGSVNKDLLSRVMALGNDVLAKELNFENVEIRKQVNELYDEYVVVVIAMQEDDLHMPQYAERAFYAVWSLLRAMRGEEDGFGGRSALSVAIGQAHEAFEMWERGTSKEVESENYLHFWWNKCLKEMVELVAA